MTKVKRILVLPKYKDVIISSKPQIAGPTTNAFITPIHTIEIIRTILSTLAKALSIKNEAKTVSKEPTPIPNAASKTQLSSNTLMKSKQQAKYRVVKRIQIKVIG